MPGRTFSSGNYRYGFNSMEKDDEILGNGNSLDFGARIYDARLGRWMATDPLAYQFPWASPYNFVFNKPMIFVDPDGRNPQVAYVMWNMRYNVSKAQLKLENPTWSELRLSATAAWYASREIVHVGLDIVGFVPVVGEVADGINAAIYVAEGNHLDAAFSAISLVPLAGDAVSKSVKYSLKVADEVGGLGLAVSRSFKSIDQAKKWIQSAYDNGIQYADEAFGFIAKAKPCGCFTAGTQVYIEDGYKNIEEIKVGDLVWAYDDKTDEIALKKVIDTFSLRFSQIYKIYFGDEVLEATHEHPFFIGGKWYKVDELKVGDILTLYDGTDQRISKIELVEGDFKVFNFTVEDFHTYYVSSSNVLVHNGICDLWSNLSPSTLASELKIAKELGVGALKIGSDNFDKVIQNGPLKFIVSTSGELKIMQKFADDGTEIAHTVLSKGENVFSAGELSIAGSRETGYYILELTNHSGHYKPSAESLEVAKEALQNGLKILGGL